ncbi:MAG: hypothetical protein ABI575_09770 [Oxalobacteraceae bacterium]
MAAFLIHSILLRLTTLQRMQIALLKSIAAAGLRARLWRERIVVSNAKRGSVPYSGGGQQQNFFNLNCSNTCVGRSRQPVGVA